jgi:MFS family permease
MPIPSLSPETPALPAPDRSFRPTVAALAAAQILAWATLFYGFSSFVLPMQRDLGWSKPLVMGAFTLGLTVWGAIAYGVGAAIDHGHGRRVMTGGALVGAAGFGVWAMAVQPWQLYAAWALLGAAQAATLYDAAFIWLTRRYPTRYRDGITALTLVAGFASTLSYPSVAGLQAAFGWRGALLALGVVLALVVAPLQAWALRGEPRGQAAHRVDTAGAPVGPAGAAGDDGVTLAQALRLRAFWLLTLAFMLYAFVSAALWAHVMPALGSAGLDERSSLWVLVWFGPSQVLGRLLHAATGRQWSLRRVGVAVLALMTLSLVVFAVGHGVAAMVVFAVAFGWANGLVTIVRGGIVPEYFGAGHVGRIGGAMSSIGLLARAVAPLLSAWLLVAAPAYGVLLGALAALGAVATLAFHAARPPRSIR